MRVPNEPWFIAIASGALGSVLGSLFTGIGAWFAIGRSAKLKEESDRRLTVLEIRIEGIRKVSGLLTFFHMQAERRPLREFEPPDTTLAEFDAYRLLHEQTAALPPDLLELDLEASDAISDLTNAVDRARFTIGRPVGPDIDDERARFDLGLKVSSHEEVLAATRSSVEAMDKYNRAANAWIEKHGR
jgi:hypothetical protein